MNFTSSFFLNFAGGAPSSKSTRPRKESPPADVRTRGAPITDRDHCEPAREMTIGLPDSQISAWLGRLPETQPDFAALPRRRADRRLALPLPPARHS